MTNGSEKFTPVPETCNPSIDLGVRKLGGREHWRKPAESRRDRRGNWGAGIKFGWRRGSG